MITPPTKSFFVIHVTGEAADFITNRFSPGVTSDIREAVLISEDYDTDIEAHNGLDDAVELVRGQLRLGDARTATSTKHNPFYVPSSLAELDSMLEGEGEDTKFVGFDGNPYTMKSIEIVSDGTPVVSARVACHQFELPSYSEILDAQENKVIN